MNKLYAKLAESKNNSLIPFFYNGKPMHSTYNPQNEGKIFASELPENSNFIIILGIGGGYHIQAAAQRFPGAVILAVENTEDDMHTILSIPCVQQLQQNPNILFCIADKKDIFSQMLKENYVPAKYGNLNIAIQRAWAEAAGNTVQDINSLIKTTLSAITADYSVQSHFGKIWQHNILSNLQLFDSAVKNHSRCTNGIITVSSEKTAAIIAAGPSLDTSIQLLKEKSNDYYIIATDTAFSALLKQNLYPDAAVSIDGQNISHAHFMEKLPPKTVFIFDVCASPAAVRKAFNAGCRILFIQTGHPLVSLAAPFLPLTSGAGTVTITAADFARKAGFTRIQTFGADFSYRNGKAYTKGTYLEPLYETASNRLSPSELLYDKLLYRTKLLPLDKDGQSFTTEVLNSYKKSFELWQASKQTQTYALKNPAGFDFKNFLEKLNDEAIQKIVFLPFAAFLRRNPVYENMSFNKILKLAHSALLRYNF